MAEVAKKIVFYVRKGGSAKTTGVVNVAGVLARRGARVLVLDFDAQGNAAELFEENHREAQIKGLEPKPVVERTLFDYLEGDVAKDDAVFSTVFKVQREGSYIIDAMRSDERFDRVKAFAGLPKQMAADQIQRLAVGGYDYILIDMPTGNDEIKDFVFSVTDAVVVPLSSDKSAIGGVLAVLGLVEAAKAANPKLVFAGGFIGRKNKTRGNDKWVLKTVRDSGVEIIGVIPDNARVAEALTFNAPISFYVPKADGRNGEGRVAYEKLTAAILKRLENISP
jgi:chromosome partitioning protein